MSESKDYLEMTFQSINCFANDGVLEVKELDKIVAIALRDGEIDQNEKRVLINIIGRLNSNDLTDTMQEKIRDLRKRYDI